MARMRWEKWRGPRADVMRAVVKVICECGNVFTLDSEIGQGHEYCVGCDRHFRVVVQVKTRCEEAED